MDAVPAVANYHFTLRLNKYESLSRYYFFLSFSIFFCAVVVFSNDVGKSIDSGKKGQEREGNFQS